MLLSMMPISYIYPDYWVSLIDLHHSGNLRDTEQLESILLPMTKTIMPHGPGGIKAAMEQLGYFGGSPMRPLSASSAAAIETIQKTLTETEAAFTGLTQLNQ